MTSSVLITGGTGSLGKELLQRFLESSEFSRIVIFSRDEFKQLNLAESLSDSDRARVRFFLGDVRDAERLDLAMRGVDEVVHAAALKQVPAAEYNPWEFIKTNVMGAQNVIESAVRNKVKKLVALSTDKASSPINLYGATKLCSDKLFVSANKVYGSSAPRMSVVRYGNVMNSRGSVIPFFSSLADDKATPVTDLNMTRFSITLSQGVNLVCYALKEGVGGEIFVPKIPSYRVVDCAEAVRPGKPIEIVGKRPGEKLHEEMICSDDLAHTLMNDEMFVICPELQKEVRAHYEGIGFRPTDLADSLNSGTNKMLTVEELRKLIAMETGYTV